MKIRSWDEAIETMDRVDRESQKLLAEIRAWQPRVTRLKGFWAWAFDGLRGNGWDVVKAEG